MFEKIKKVMWPKAEEESQLLESKVSDDGAEKQPNSIAAPKSDAFQQPQAGPLPRPTSIHRSKFNYYSATWQYLQPYFEERLRKLTVRLEKPSLDYEATQVIRGQMKEIKILLKHTNELAGISEQVSPINSSPNFGFADKESNYV